jgi:PAS domain S-box-containing protein
VGRPLRNRILVFVGALIVLSVLGSTLSLYRITEVSHSLDAINRISVPLSRLMVQLHSDAEVLHRELERRLGSSNWKNPHWQPQPTPKWMGDIIQHELAQVRTLIEKEDAWGDSSIRKKWVNWIEQVEMDYEEIKESSSELYSVIRAGDRDQASALYQEWRNLLENWNRKLKWGSVEFERAIRADFSQSEAKVQDLKAGLQVILIVVAVLSFLLLWLGERTLRPLNELTALAREITERGLKKGDKNKLPLIPLNRKDEVSRLAREFHRMATALLEREKTVESQKERLQDQNRLLREIGALNKNILNSIESVLLVVDLDGKITHGNPVACRWLGVSLREILGKEFFSIDKLKTFKEWLLSDDEGQEGVRIPATLLEARVYSGQWVPLRQQNGERTGSILVLDDSTDQVELQQRLRLAENLAAVGRMSAQVAHEVRNPLHSIGLEAEMALELLEEDIKDSRIAESVKNILSGVDRLEKITENYLKLSRLSSGEKKVFELSEALEAVLGVYASHCQAQGVQVDWKREADGPYFVLGDQDLLEQVLGNLFKNALQALDGYSPEGHSPRISWRLSKTKNGETLLSVEDNGPGFEDRVRERLFSPFVTTKAQGTGLGLSFVKRVLQDHDGDIVLVENESNPTRGSTRFDLTFPRAEPASEDFLWSESSKNEFDVKQESGEVRQKETEGVVHG